METNELMTWAFISGAVTALGAFLFLHDYSIGIALAFAGAFGFAMLVDQMEE